MQDAGANNAEGGAGGQADQRQVGDGIPGAAPVDELVRVARDPHIPGPGGDAGTLVRDVANPLHEIAFTVPFRSSVEAEIARGSLAPDDEPQGEMIYRELVVAGRNLSVRFIAEDPRSLRIATMSFFDQLHMVVQTMERFGPPVFH